MTRLYVTVLALLAWNPQTSSAEPQDSHAVLLQVPFADSQIATARQEWANLLGEAETITNDLKMTLVLVPAGRFTMGSPDDEPRRTPREGQRRVTVSRPFFMATTEVTQGQWAALMQSRPWQGKRFVREGADQPVTNVRWEDATDFCRRLSEKEERTYRLPSEAEWEFACRAGTVTAYSFGDEAGRIGDVAWVGANTFDIDVKHAQAVGRKPANAFVLHDMHGNVWEWCSDWYAETPNPKDNVDPRGPSEGKQRVIRGGSWHGAAHLCRSANRFYRRPDMQTNDVGFRVVLDPDP